MPDTEMGGLRVVVSAEVDQAIKALKNMSAQFEDTADVAQRSSNTQQDGFAEVERGMDKNKKQHEKHSEGVMGSLKKIGIAWTAITGAAIGGIYGLLRASSYGSLYFGQWGAITKDVANTAIKPLIPALNDATNAYKTFADNIKTKGVWDALKIGISDAITWFLDLDTGWQILIATIGILLGATAIAGLIAILPTLGAAVGAVIAVLTSTAGLIVAVLAVIAILASFILKSESVQKTLTDLSNGWTTFKNNMSDVGFIEAAKIAIGDFIDWFFAPEQWAIGGTTFEDFINYFKVDIPDSLKLLLTISVAVLGAFAALVLIFPALTAAVIVFVLTMIATFASLLLKNEKFIDFFEVDIPNAVDTVIEYFKNLKWPDIPNPFDIDWLGGLADWVKGVLGLENYEWSIKWPIIPNPFTIDYLQGVMDWVKGILGLENYTWSITWPTISNPFGSINWCGIIPDWVKNILGICGGTGNGGGGDTGGVSATTSGGVSGAISAATSAVSSVVSAASAAVSSASSSTSAVSSVVSAASSAVSAVSSAVSSIASAASAAISSAVSAASSAASSVASAATSAVSSAASAISSAIGGVGGGLKSYQTGGYVEHDTIARLHAGEYVIPPGGNRTMNSGNTTISPIINLTVNTGTANINNRRLADDISKLLADEIKRMVKT